MAAVNASAAAPLHPYYPLGVEIVGYLANEWNTFELVSMFAAGCAVIFSITYAILMKLRPNASKSDVSIMMWFVLCGCIHSFFEGYFAYNFRRMGGMQDLFGQLWKEYALSDSRYLTQDAFVLCMETVTAVRLPQSIGKKQVTNETGLLGTPLLRHRLLHRR
jgi:cholestenol delta-isomerase